MGKRRWTDEEIAFLRENTDKEAAFVAKKLDRTVGAIESKRFEIGIVSASSWTDEEIAFLRENTDKPRSYQAKKLGRTVSSVKQMRFKLGIASSKLWTDEEIAFLRENVDMSYSYQAKKLGRTVDAIENKRKRLGIIKKKKWTEEEIAFLRKNADMPCSYQAEKLGRTVDAVRHMRRIAGIASSKLWTDEEIAFLAANTRLSYTALAKKMGRTKEAVKNKMQIVRLIEREKRKFSLEALRNHARLRGGRCVSREYTNAYAEYEFKCKCGYTWTDTPLNILYYKKWCPACDESINILWLQRKMEEFGCSLVTSGKIIICKYPSSLYFRCKKGHLFSLKNNIKTLNPILKRGWKTTPCPICRKGLHEKTFLCLFAGMPKARFFPAKKAAKILNCSRANVREKIQRGTIEHIRVNGQAFIPEYAILQIQDKTGESFIRKWKKHPVLEIIETVDLAFYAMPTTHPDHAAFVVEYEDLDFDGYNLLTVKKYKGETLCGIEVMGREAWEKLARAFL